MHVGKGHHHAAMGVHHAVGMVLFDQKGAAVIIGPVIFVKRSDLTAKTPVPVEQTIALWDHMALTGREFVRHKVRHLYFVPSD